MNTTFEIDFENKRNVAEGRRYIEMMLGRYTIPTDKIREWLPVDQRELALTAQKRMREHAFHIIMNLRFVETDTSFNAYDLEKVAVEFNLKEFYKNVEIMKPICEKAAKEYAALIRDF